MSRSGCDSRDSSKHNPCAVESTAGRGLWTPACRCIKAEQVPQRLQWEIVQRYDPCMRNTPLAVDLHEKIECAHTIESKFYNDPAILATEKAKIFLRTWQLAGTLNHPCGPAHSG